MWSLANSTSVASMLRRSNCEKRGREALATVLALEHIRWADFVCELQHLLNDSRDSGRHRLQDYTQEPDDRA
jgi:hypothetical protein